MLISNIFLEFTLLKSTRKRDYNRSEMSQLVRSRKWHTHKLPIISEATQIQDNKLEGLFNTDDVFVEFHKYMVYEFGFLTIPEGTLLCTTWSETNHKLGSRRIRVHENAAIGPLATKVPQLQGKKVSKKSS
jgi:hypothetical protein